MNTVFFLQMNRNNQQFFLFCAYGRTDRSMLNALKRKCFGVRVAVCFCTEYTVKYHDSELIVLEVRPVTGW